MNVIGVITVRLSSVRLPKKALLSIEGKSFLEHLVEKVSLARTLSRIVIATTNSPIDKEIVALAQKNRWEFFVGDEFNVLKRLIDVGKKYQGTQIVRITADNIFTDPDNIDRMVKNHIRKCADYTITTRLPLGITAEVISLTALRNLQKKGGDDPEVQEHITPYIRRHPELFKINIIQAPSQLRHPEYRLTCDYKEDLQVIKAIFKSLYSKAISAKQMFSLLEIINFLKSHPEIARINSRLTHSRTDYQI